MGAAAVQYPNTPGINEERHVEAWKPIVQAVHEKGANFFMQLWHVGRVSHAVYQPDDQGPVAASAIAISGEQVITPECAAAQFAAPQSWLLYCKRAEYACARLPFAGLQGL